MSLYSRNFGVVVSLELQPDVTLYHRTCQCEPLSVPYTEKCLPLICQIYWTNAAIDDLTVQPIHRLEVPCQTPDISFTAV